MKFKPILAWLKDNVWIVASCAIILIVIPASFVVSRAWNKKILADQQQLGTTEFNAIKNARIEYHVPQYDPTIAEVKFSSEPNPALTAAIKKVKEAASGEVVRVAKAAEDFNRGVGPAATAVGRSEFTPLVDGLFPKVAMTEDEAKDANAAKDKESAKLNEAEDKFLGKRGNVNPYQALLKSINAGGPVANDALFTQLKEQRAREEEKLTQNKRKLEPDEEKTLLTMMKGARLGTYQAKAKSIGVYMTMDAFPAPATDEARASSAVRQPNDDAMEPLASIVLGSIERKDLTRPKLFMHQWDLWELSDLLAAVRLANTGPDGKQQSVESAVVKRIESIVLRNPDGMKTLDPLPPPTEDAFTTPPTPPAPPAETIPGLAALDRSVSITGRVRGGWNQYYEVRRADMVCVVSSARLQQFLAAIQQTNYMTVIDLDIDSPVSVWDELAQGYYYGDEHVVRVKVSIESVWLKSWLVPFMPVEVQKALGMEVPAEAVPDAAAPPASGAPAAPAGPTRGPGGG